MYKIPKTETTYTGNPASFTIQNGDSTGLKSLTAAITPVQSGSGDPSPSNVRPITGFTGVTINRTGKNMFDEANATVYKRYMNASDKWMGDANSGSYAFPCKPDTDYAVTANNENLALFRVGYINDTDITGTGEQIYSVTRLTGPGSIQLHTGSDATYIVIQCNVAFVNAKNTQAQVEYGTIASDYESYTGSTYTADWTSAAGTVYAGSYEAVSGKLKARPQYASYNGETLVGPWLSSMDVYAEGATPTTGAQVVDLGGTETEYTLTPQQVASLVGQNYAWSNLNSTVSATVLSESPFHALSTSDSTKSRCRIYFIGDNVDCTDDDDVMTNGVLMKGDPDDTDSNSVIDLSSGISITESFNKDTEAGIGSAASYSISCSFLNRNNALDGFDYGRCKIYIDVYDDDNSAWIPCPLGVFFFEVPVKRRTRIVSATGYDQMYLLDSIADTWWNGLDWPSGLTITNIIQSLASTLGIHLSSTALTNISNGSMSFSSLPFKSVERTFRDILQFVAEATGTTAMFDRDGALDFRWFAAASYGYNTFEIDVDDQNTTCLSIDLAEYTVPAVEQLVVKASDSDVGAAVGTGDNQYAVINNPFMGGADEATIISKATPLYNTITGLGSYDPMSLKLISDYSIEAGDIINIVYQGVTYQLPIFQQTLTWRGGHVFSTPQSSGSKKRPTQTAPKREEFRSKTQMHEFEVNLERLLSRIESIDGNFTQIEQTVNAITQTVSNQNVTIEDILDPDGEIWSAIKGNTTNITNLGNTVEADKDYQRSYIRFIPAEPAIVLGVDTANAIKLKLVNNVIYFFNGADDSTDLSLAYAYFNSQEAGADRFVASESVQAGDWIWHQLANGHFVLDYAG